MRSKETVSIFGVAAMLSHRHRPDEHSNFSFSPPLQNMVAAPLSSFIAVLHLCLVQFSHGGTYFGRKQPPQPPQPPQPLPQYNDGFPQQPFKGNEMPRVTYGKDVPLLPQYGKELPQLPLQMGNERPLVHGKGRYCQFAM